MAGPPDKRELLARAARCRERATIARHLAAQLADSLASQSLLDRATALDSEADGLEAAAAGGGGAP